jgi:hypothetical protein
MLRFVLSFELAGLLSVAFTVVKILNMSFGVDFDMSIQGRVVGWTLYNNFSFNGFRTIEDFVPYDPAACTSCQFTPRNLQSDSTPRDLILTFSLMAAPQQVEIFLRSLRTTGCKATVVLIVDGGGLNFFTDGILRLLTACGCTLIQSPPALAGGWTIFMFRHVFAYFFLKERPGIFHRALVVDLYDTAFQGDPFHTGLKDDFVGMSAESSPCSLEQKECAADVGGWRIAGWWGSTPCKNAGMFIGGASRLEQFYGAYVSFMRAKRHRIIGSCYIVDQVVHNILWGSGLYADLGFRLVAFDKGSVYRAMDGVWNRDNVTYELGHYRLYDDRDYPLVLHMFDRSRRLCDSAWKACKPVFLDDSDHAKCKLFAR